MLEIPRITRRLDLSAYDAAYAGLAFEVWVNVSRRHVSGYGELVAALEAEPEKPGRLLAWWADVWGVEVPVIEEFYEAVAPSLWAWLLRRSFELMAEYREEVGGEKNSGSSGPGETGTQDEAQS